MSYYSAPPPPAPAPAFMPAPATATAHCFTGPSWLINIGEIVALILAAVFGAVVGGVLSWVTGGLYGVACKWVVGLFGRIGGAFFSTPTDSAQTWLAAMPPHVAGGLVTAMIAGIIATIFLKASECGNCPPGRKAICVCICYMGPLPMFPFPCGGMCTIVPVNCP